MRTEIEQSKKAIVLNESIWRAVNRALYAMEKANFDLISERLTVLADNWNHGRVTTKCLAAEIHVRRSQLRCLKVSGVGRQVDTKF